MQFCFLTVMAKKSDILILKVMGMALLLSAGTDSYASTDRDNLQVYWVAPSDSGLQNISFDKHTFPQSLTH